MSNQGVYQSVVRLLLLLDQLQVECRTLLYVADPDRLPAEVEEPDAPDVRYGSAPESVAHAMAIAEEAEARQAAKPSYIIQIGNSLFWHRFKNRDGTQTGPREIASPFRTRAGAERRAEELRGEPNSVGLGNAGKRIRVVEVNGAEEAAEQRAA